MLIDGTIWCAAAHKNLAEESENGMVQFDLNTNKIINIIQYPPNMTPRRHCCVEYKKKIYLIDGEHGEIILFDPTTKEFNKLLDIPNIGRYPCSVVIFDKIHICHGAKNTKHYVYDIQKNEIKSYDDQGTNDKMETMAIINYKNKIIKWSGFSYVKNVVINTLWISSEIKDEEDEDFDIKWEIKPEFEMKTTLNKCGYILYRNYLITFGGDADCAEFIDTVYILDLEDDVGWIELKHIKCPIKGRYLAIMDDNKVIHLFNEVTKWPDWRKGERGHYSIPVATIFGSKYMDIDC